MIMMRAQTKHNAEYNLYQTIRSCQQRIFVLQFLFTASIVSSFCIYCLCEHKQPIHKLSDCNCFKVDNSQLGIIKY